MPRLRTRWLTILLHVGSLAPVVTLASLWAAGELLAPASRSLSITGRGGLILLLLSLVCTPLHDLTGYRAIPRVRRLAGLYAVAYASLHLLAFVGLDYGFQLALILRDLRYQPYVVLGLTTFALLLPLAITSTPAWQRRLGRRWKRLHRLAYVAAALDVAHYLWLVKTPSVPLRYAMALAALLALRLPPIRRHLQAFRRRFARSSPSPSADATAGDEDPSAERRSPKDAATREGDS